MGALNLKNAHAADSKLVKSRVRSTIRAAMNPSNPNYMITSIKIDFSNGPLLVGDDPRYVYRSPEMTIEAIPIISYDESDVSIASETVNSGSRQYAGGEVTAIQNGDKIVETNPSMLNAMVNGLPTENASEIYQAYLNANDLAENEHPFLPKENDANYMSKENIVQWIEEGEKATTTSAPQQAEWEVTSMNSYSNLESILSTSEKVDYGIREINHDGCRDDETLKDVTSLASVDESDSILSSDFSDVPIIHTPHPSGSRGGNIEEAIKRRTPKTNQ